MGCIYVLPSLSQVKAPFAATLHLIHSAQTPLSVRLENAVTCATLGHKSLRTQLKQSKDTARTEQGHS